MVLGSLAAEPSRGSEPTPADHETVRHSAPPGPSAASADRQQLRQILRDHPIEVRRPRPGVSLYVADAGNAFGRWIQQQLLAYLPSFASLANTRFEQVLKVLLAILALVLLAALLHFALRHWPRRAQADPHVVPLTTQETRTDSPRWENELEQRLADGDAEAAVLALWWWLAERLVGDRAESSWTSRELIRHAGRKDLMPAIRRLDRILYGGDAPQVAAIRRLWGDLREAS
ncbi:MAG: hypothetical protein AAF657_29480 [Acidobacteriota bacterium]